MPEPVRRTPPARMPAAPAATSSAGGGSVAPPSQHTHVQAHAPAHVPANHQTNVPTHGTGHLPANHQTNVQAHVPTNAQTPGTTNIQANQQAHVPTNVHTNVPANHQTNVQVHAPMTVQAAVPSSVPSSVRGPVSAPSPVPMTVSQPVPMTVSQPSMVATSQPTPMTVDSEPVMRRAPPPEQQQQHQQQQQQPPVDEWARYHAQQMDHSGHHAQQMDAEQLAAVAAAQTGVYATGGHPPQQHQQHQQQHQQQQHGVSASANGDQDENDSSNRNSMGFQITSITQSSAEPDAEPIDESGDEDVSDVAESARLSAGGGGGSIGSGTGGGVSAVDGLPGRLQLPLAGTPPSAALTPRELTASPGVTSSEVLPVIPTIDGFGITLVPGALESVDAHGNAEIVEFPSEIEMDLMPTGLTVGVAPGSPGDDLQETWQSRFKVVKIETNVPFKRGRWQCMDYMDQPEASGGTAEVTASAGSSAHSSVHAGELEQPQPAASEEASLPGLQDEPAGGVRWEPRIDAATPDPAAAAAGAGAAGPQPSLSVPHQAHAGPPHPGGGGGLLHSRDAAAAASAPNVHSAATDRGASLALGVQTGAAAAGLARQSSQPATPEEARLAADGVPVFRSAPPEDGTLSPSAGGGPGGLTLPDLLPNSSLLELVQASVTDEQEGTADSSFSGLARALSTGQYAVLGSSPPAERYAAAAALAAASVAGPLESASTSPGSSGTVEKTEPIDNKIEQAMDLVKSHLLLAVREEVDVLKANISKLVDKISVLERENEVLKSNASPQVLAQLESAPSLAPSPPPPVSVVASVAAVSAPVTVPVMSAPAAAPAVLPAQVAVPAPQQQQMQQMQVQPPPGVGPAP